MMRSENKYCLRSESRWKVKQSSQSEVLWSAGSTEELAMTTGNFSPSLLCWKIKTCPSLMAEAILPASTKKKMSKLSGNSNHSNLEVHQCFGDISFNAESSRPSLDDSNCDNPFAHAPAKAHMPSPHVSWAVGLAGLYPLPADLHHLPKRPASEKRLVLGRKQTSGFVLGWQREISSDRHKWGGHRLCWPTTPHLPYRKIQRRHCLW